MEKSTRPRSFKWSDIHSIAQQKLNALQAEIESEVRAKLQPFPFRFAPSVQHQYFLLLEERAEKWAERACEAYLACLNEIDRGSDDHAKLSVWNNGLRFFIAEEIRYLVELSCGHDVRRQRKNDWDFDMNDVLLGMTLAVYINPCIERISERAKKMMCLIPTTGGNPVSNAIPLESSAPLIKPKEDEIRKSSILKRLEGDLSGHTLSYSEAAIVLDISVRTLRNWIDEGKLIRGSKRGRVSSESVKIQLS
jgi:hypothetical protein